MTTTPRVRAPELYGRHWLNTGGRSLSIKDLRGKIVLLDFWTFCCINCLHVLAELRPLERKYGDVLVVIGVHSPKFEHEKDPDALAAAVARYDVGHPVLDDPELSTWRQYTARAWPTLCVVDPEGYLVATMAGEGHADGLAALIDDLVAVHDARGTLHRGEGPYVPPPSSGGMLRFPGKALLAPDGHFFVSSSAGHQIVELAPDAQTPVRVIGTGQRGRADGGPDEVTFAEPQGLCLLPEHIAELAGYDLVVADTANHLLRGVRLADGNVRTIAGSGRPWRGSVDFHAHDALAADLSSPWDLAWYDDRLIIAMAGIHQLWWFDPVKRTTGSYAGTTVEALRDGPLEQVFMAQPSGLSAAGDRLWIADSESSALRYISAEAGEREPEPGEGEPEAGENEPGQAEMHTVVGQGLFDFGLVDGAAEKALLQHPLGVCALPDGSVLVADTYNGAIRRYAESTTGGGTMTTVATGLAEPSDIVLTSDGGVLVVESAAHRLSLLAPGALAAASALAAAGVASGGTRMHTDRPVTQIRPGEFELEVIFTPMPGQRLDDSYGPPIRLEVSATPAALLGDGAGTGTELTRRLVVAADVDGGVLQVVAQVATCDAESEHAACHLTRQDWGIPVSVTADGDGQLRLALRAT